MPSYTKHIQTFYTPSNIEQYTDALKNFEWNLFLTDNYYPSLDSIHRFLYQLRSNGEEWKSIYDHIYKEKYVQYMKENE